MPESAYIEHIADYVRAQHVRTPTAFGDRQTKALQALLACGLPTVADEAYRYTPLVRKLRAAMPYTANDALPTGGGRSVPKVSFASTAVYVPWFNNTCPVQGLPSLPKGLHVSSLADAYVKQPQYVAKAFSSPLHKEDAFVMLNEAAFTHGLFVYVAPDVTIHQPLVLHQHADMPVGTSLASHPRTFIYLDKGAKLTLVDMQTSQGPGTAHPNSVCEVICAQGASLTSYKLQADAAQTLRIDHTYVALQDGAKLTNHVFSAGASMLRNNLYIHLCEKAAEATLNGFYTCGAHGHIDNHSTVDHLAPHSQSNQYYKGILGGRGRGVFNGRILMRPGAVGAVAYQSNRNLLFSPHAKVHAKPQLEIYVDDVRCSHGCTVGTLSPEQRFYLQSRGVPRKLAEEMLLVAFMEEMLIRLTEESLINYLKSWLNPFLRNVSQ